MSDKTKKIRAMIPGVNLDKVFGPRDKEMSESVTETRSRLDKKRDELASLELDAEILEVEDKIRRRRGGEAGGSETKKDLGEKLVEEVVIPIVSRKLSEDEGGKESSDVVDRALRIAEKAVSRKAPEREEGSALDELDKVIGAFTKIRGLIEGEKEEKEETGEETKREVDSLTQLDKGIDLVKKIRDTFPQEGSGGGMSQAMIDFKKWEKEFELKHTKADREYRLSQRRIDKEHDARLAELGIEKERNDLLRDGFKRVGRAVALALGEEEEFEEEEEPAPAKGRRQLIKEKCEVCGAEMMIPPEAQVKGKEIKCSSCNSIFKWE